MIEAVDRSWQRLELRHLVALAAVARCRSFRGAARALGYSQSAISAQIAGLEAIVGATVLDRSAASRLVTPTVAGRILLEHAERVGRDLSSAHAAIRALDSTRTDLRVGIFQSVATAILPSILRELRAEMTDLEVRATEAIDPLHLLDGVAQGELDLAFANPTHDARLESCPLIEDPYIVLVAAGHPLAAAPCVSATALSEWPLIAYRTVPDRLYPPAIEIDPEAVVYRTDDDAAIRAMVASGVGIAVVPRLSVDLHDHRTRTVPIEPPFPARTITLFWRRGARRNAAVAEFIRIAQRSRSPGITTVASHE